MILKLLINFYLWLWGLGPLAVQKLDEPTVMMIILGAFIDIGVIIGIIELAITAYNYRNKVR